ncbi:MAG TPA: DNA polymerase IV [Candidatus Eisenbacteria bacterium]
MTGPIAHVDMDAFFAAVEVRANPKLEGKPLLVGGGPAGRQVVTTASYPARRFGIRSGMSLSEARSRCPAAIFLPVEPARYLSASEELVRLFERFTPLVEPASIDEVFLDLTGLAAEADGGEGLARAIQDSVRREQRLGCSIGLGETKLIAKMATSLHKPEGLTRLTRADFQQVFWPRPTGALWGVGPESEAVLHQLGIRTIGELAACPTARLERVFGVTAAVLVRMAAGEGGGSVVPYFEGLPVRSMGHETTFPVDLVEGKRLERHLLLLTDKVSRRLRREGRSGHRVTLRIRFSDGTTITRQRALAAPTDDDRILFRVAAALLADNVGGRAVRLLGINVGHLVGPGATGFLLPEDQRQQRLGEVRDRLRDRFGESSLIPGGVVALIKDEGQRS